jgi:hypothetical protein
VATFKPESPLELHRLVHARLGEDLPTRIGVSEVKDKLSGRTGGMTYRLAGDLDFQVELFNDKKDRDRRHGIIGKVSRRDISRKVNWYPLIELGSSGAWLKYTSSVEIAESSKSGAGGLLGLKASKGLDHFYYHKHRRNKLLLNAVSADLANLKSAFSLDDVLSLDESQAAGFATAGRVRMSMEISWSDLLASGMTRLAGLLATSGAIAINLPGSASAEFEVDIRDSFKLVFLGRPDDVTRVALRKSRSEASITSLDAGMKVRFARPSDIRQILDDVVAGLLGISPKRFRNAVVAIKKKVNLEDLSSPEKDLLESLVENLGLDDEFERVTDALDVLDDFQAKVSSTLNDVARVKVWTSIAYEYSRLDTDASIYLGDFEQAALTRNFRNILAGNFQVLLADARNHPGEINTLRFLNEKSLVIRHSTGLSLGAGKWSVSGKESTVFRFVTQESQAKAVRHSLLGSRKYQGKYFGPLESILLEFKAGMPEFSPAGERIEVKDFRLGLAVSYEDGKAWSSNRRLKSFLDMGLLCGIAPAGDLETLLEHVRTTFGRYKTRCKITLRLSHSAMLGFCEWLARSSPDELARAFAGAMEYQEKHPALQMIHSRRFLYSKFWQQALRRRWDDPYQASRFAMQSFRPLDTSLYRREKLSLRGRKKDPATVFMLFRRNPDLLEDFQTMRDACASLHDVFAQSSPFEELKEIARDIHSFANTRFKTRVLGALINAWAIQREENMGEINLAIVIKADNGSQSMTIGR